MSNKNKEKQDCIKDGGQWKDPPGECERAFPLMDTSLTDANVNEEKKECEARGGVWKEPPGECEEPNE